MVASTANMGGYGYSRSSRRPTVTGFTGVSKLVQFVVDRFYTTVTNQYLLPFLYDQSVAAYHLGS
jgi:hypothetical protein